MSASPALGSFVALVLLGLQQQFGNLFSRFSACELCWHFKNDIANSKTLEERLGQLVKYRQHLAHQYQDRAICWALQELVLDDQSDLVCIQVDGLDQSKFSLPRDPKLRATSSV